MVLGSVIAIVLLVFVLVEDPAADMGGVPAWIGAALGIPVFGLAAGMGLLRIRRRAREPLVERLENQALTDPPAPVSLRSYTPASTPDASYERFDAGAKQTSDTRGPDWANAAMTLVAYLSIPIVASAIIVNLDPPPSVWIPLGLWSLGIYLGLWYGWEAWHGLIREETLQVDWNQAELSGLTPRPIKRRRRVRLDQLASVTCRKIFERYGVSIYYILRDRDGHQAMVEETPATRAAIVQAVNKYPGARVGHVASRRLAGMFTWWVYPLSWLVMMAHLFISGMAAIGISAALGFSI